VSIKGVRTAMQLVEANAAKALPLVRTKSVQDSQPKSRKTLHVVKSKSAGA
jgi:hypothetical protein